MQHPFEGVLPAQQESAPQIPEHQPTPARRAFLGKVLGAVGAFFGVQAAAQAQFVPRGRVTTYALGEEGGRVTTYALGEEGGGWRRPPYRPPPPPYSYPRHPATTYALGEEGGVTTYALGEEGGWYTTQALGEEGGGYATTYALGEEG